MTTLKATPLLTEHQRDGARLVDFGGWNMPVNYGSQIEEHHAVREATGLFDVSHMTVVDIDGDDARVFLRRLLANDVAKLDGQPGRALYGCMCDLDGGVIDDLITYFIADNHYRLVVNAATREQDLAWINKQAEGVKVRVVERDDLAMIAVQGPKARALYANVAGHTEALAIKRFAAQQFGDHFVARTGYTGEDGFEVVLPNEQAATLWRALVEAGGQPCGLGARDTLRLEAGLNLYGQDMDQTVSPLECGLGWTVAFEPEDRDFNGRSTLAQQRDGAPRQWLGVVLVDRGVLRASQRVLDADAQDVGQITSGTFSPSLSRSIGFAMVSATTKTPLAVDVRGKQLALQVVSLPFVRNGKVLVDL